MLVGLCHLLHGQLYIPAAPFFYRSPLEAFDLKVAGGDLLEGAGRYNIPSTSNGCPVWRPDVG